MQDKNNEKFEKNPDSGTENSENQESLQDQNQLKESFSRLEKELSDQLNKLKNQIKEGHENKEDIVRIQQIEKQLQNINQKIEQEKQLEETSGGEGKINNSKELKIVKQIDERLAQNPGEANKGRAQSALKLLDDIHGKLDPNRIARSSQWLIKQLTK